LASSKEKEKQGKKQAEQKAKQSSLKEKTATPQHREKKKKITDQKKKGQGGEGRGSSAGINGNDHCRPKKAMFVQGEGPNEAQGKEKERGEVNVPIRGPLMSGGCPERKKKRERTNPTKRGGMIPNGTGLVYMRNIQRLLRKGGKFSSH